MSKVHHLKVEPRFWPDYRSGLKTHSIRKNDRNFGVGDICVYQLWEEDRFILNEMCVYKISHIVRDYESKAIKEGYCVLSHQKV